MFGRKFTIEKINMEELRPPYLLLSNHMYFIDFKICAVATWPHRVNNVVSIDGYHRRPFLMEWIGAICTRKFTADIHLVKSISKVLKRGDILCMYPEARYTPCGTTAYLPESLGKLIKMNKVPVVTMIYHGNHLDSPFWNWRKKRKVPLHAVMTQILTADQVKEQIDRGEYAFADDVDVYSLPNCWKFEHLGLAKLTHDPENGFVLDGVYRGEKYHVQRNPLENNSLHVEYDYCYIKPEDCFDLSIENDSFCCYPKQQNVITKLAFATEEIYQRALAKKRQRVAPLNTKSPGIPGLFCALKNKKPRKNPWKVDIKQLTNGGNGCIMVFHNVLVCPNSPSYSTWTYYHRTWRLSSAKLHKTGNEAGRTKIVNNTHCGESRKKGCDDPYGNGQGRNVRQDHA